ncbi:DHA2 family efflux MFS transporter permease subunit [Mycobacterium rhizamassiliense]|nr:DHA2 family efflux MFS transporter permease subunit [Mycobacterium rhizamassiliense]
MLGDAMKNPFSAASDFPAALGVPAQAEREYPDKLDARLLRIGAVCGLAAVMGALDSTIVAVAQHTFVIQFQSTPGIVAWTVAGYLLAFATVIPMTGWAADRFGAKRIFIGAVLVFTVGSLLCAVAPNILLLILFRMVQGAGGGVLAPVSFAIMTREAGPKRLGRLVAVGGIPVLLGPICGPILGGWLIGTYGWKWIFLINVPIGVLVVVFAAILFPREEPCPSETFDFVGVLLLSPGLVIFLFGVSSIGVRGTVADRYVLLPTALGLALIGGFVWHALHRADHPLIDLHLFRNPGLTRANVTVLVFATAAFGCMLLLPGYYQLVLHRTPIQAALYMLPQGIGAMSTIPLAGIFMDKRGAGKIVMAGISVIVVGLGIVSYGMAKQAPFTPILLIGLAIIGMGMGCTLMPLTGASVQTLAPHQIARGTTVISVNHQIAGSLGTAVMSMILTNQFNRSEYITAANKISALEEASALRGVPVNPSAIPSQSLAPGFWEHANRDYSHAYTLVFAIAAVFVALSLIPASFLSRTPADETADA